MRSEESGTPAGLVLPQRYSQLSESRLKLNVRLTYAFVLLAFNRADARAKFDCGRMRAEGQ
jgi:hypothetical protein